MGMHFCLLRRECGGRNRCRVAVQGDRSIVYGRLRFEIASAVLHDRWHSDSNVFDGLEPNSTSSAGSHGGRIDNK